MATFIGGPSHAVSGEDLGRFAGFQHQNPYQEALYDYFEQAFAKDPYRLAAGIDIEPYLQGVNVDAAGGMGNPNAIATNTAAFNTILQRMAQAGQAPAGYAPLAGWNDFLARQDARGGGFTQGSGLGDFLSGSIQHLGDTASELWSEPGFRQLALTAAGGAYAGSQAAPAAGAAAEGTAAASTVPGATATGAAGSPLYSTPGAMGTNAFGGAFSTPAMTTFAGPTGSALGGFAAPATLGAGGTLAGASALAGAGGGAGAPITTGGAAGVGGASSGIAGILSSPTALGMGAGALLGGLGGSQQAGTITVEEGLPDWLMAYAKPQLDKYSTELQNYQIDPYGVMPSAMQEFQKTISGQYLDPSTNKYLEDYFKLGAERIKGSLSPSFGFMQAFGQHSGYNEALSRGLGDFATGLYGGNYAKERDRQTQLTAAAPSFLAGSSTAAFTPYQQYLGTIGNLGRKKDQPVYENAFGNILGGALTGGALANMYNFGK